MSNLSELLPTGGGQNAVDFVAAENISAGQAVALKTDGQIEAADSANLENVIGLAAEAITSGNTGAVNVFGGINEAQSGLTIGSNYYVNSSGSLTTSATFPNIELGQAISATTINLRDFSDNYNPLVQGQQAYTTPGTYSWVCPTGVTSVSVVCVGAGSWGTTTPNAGGGGGALAYVNNTSVVPGNSYSVVVSATGALGVRSSKFSTVCEAGSGGNATVSTAGGTVITGTGGAGGTGGADGGDYGGGGGGAGGYAGTGGNGGNGKPFPLVGNFNSGTNGAGGGGGGGTTYADGGGVGILGQGSNGVGGTDSTQTAMKGTPGSGGSLMLYGGGGYGSGSDEAGVGAVRIIWSNGVTRAFPSTNTGDL